MAKRSYLVAIRREVLDAAEHALDGVAVAVEEGREATLPATIDLRRDVGHHAALLNLTADRVAVIAFVAIEDQGWGHLLQ